MKNFFWEEKMLELTAFVCGAVVMILEMTGSRLLAPWLGSSVLVWTALIGMILAFLSAGYLLGGKMADQKPKPQILAVIILLASFCILLTGFFHGSLLAFLVQTRIRPELGASIATAILFGPASLLLGMVAPYIVRVAIETRKTSIEKTGSLIGRFSALSATGSILGTFLGGYVLISWVGSGVTIYFLASVLFCASLLVFFSAKFSFRKHFILFLLPVLGLDAAFLLVRMEQALARENARLGLLRMDTRYSRVDILTGPDITGRTLRILSTPPDLTQSLMYLDQPEELADFYTRNFAVAWQIRPEASRFLMLGGAGCSIPKYLLHTRPGITMDVVEIDPAMTKIAQDFFFLTEAPGLAVFHEDARTFLNRETLAAKQKAPYEIIMGDTFGSAYNIPFQLATVEAAEKIHALLDEEGMYICNIISAARGEKSALLSGIRASFQEVFAEVHLFPARPEVPPEIAGNQILLALKKSGSLPSVDMLKKNSPTPFAGAFPEKAAREHALAVRMLETRYPAELIPTLPPLRDDFAPVERYALPLFYRD